METTDKKPKGKGTSAAASIVALATLGIAVAGIIFSVGSVYQKVCLAESEILSLKMATRTLEQDNAVNKEALRVISLDIKEMKSDVKTLLRNNP